MENKTQWSIGIAAAALLGGLFLWRALAGEVSLGGLFAGAAMAMLFLFVLIPLLSESRRAFCENEALSPDAALGARSLRRARRHPWAEIAFFVLALRLALFLLAYFAYCLGREYPGGLWDTLRTVWLRSDSPSYLGIAENWYVTQGDPRFHIVFFPLYPMAIALFNLLTGDSFASAMAVSTVASLGAAVLIYETAALDYPRETALRAVKYAMILPAAFFFAAPMTESLFFALTLGAVYAVRKKKYFIGCVLAALSGFTRSVGGLLLAFIAYEWLMDVLAARRAGTLAQEKKTHILQALCMLIVPLGLVAYLFINYRVTGDPLTFMTYQKEHWGQGFGFFFETAATQLDYALRAVADGQITKLLGLWLPNLLYSFASLALVAGAVKKMRPSYTAYFLVYFVVTCGATWLLSSPRYLTAAFPLAMAMAALTKERSKDGVATLACLLLLAGYLGLYANGQYVY